MLTFTSFSATLGTISEKNGIMWEFFPKEGGGFVTFSHHFCDCTAQFRRPDRNQAESESGKNSHIIPVFLRASLRDHFVMEAVAIARLVQS